MIDQLQEETQHLRHTLAHPGALGERLRNWLRDPDVRLGFSLIGGTAVWALNFMGLNALNSLACRWGWFGVPADSGGLKTVQITISALSALLMAASILNCWSLWHSTRRRASADAGKSGEPLQPGLLEQTVAARVPFLAFVTMLLNVLYLIIILISLGPISTLAVCGGYGG